MRQTRAEWARRIEEWKRSGLSGAEFAARAGVKESTLRYWKWQVGRQAKKAARPGFVEVVAAPGGLVADAPPLEVLVGARRVLVPAGFDEDTLRRLLRVLEGR
jgi:hypothetical protein